MEQLDAVDRKTPTAIQNYFKNFYDAINATEDKKSSNNIFEQQIFNKQAKPIDNTDKLKENVSEAWVIEIAF